MKKAPEGAFFMPGLFCATEVEEGRPAHSVYA